MPVALKEKFRIPELDSDPGSGAGSVAPAAGSVTWWCGTDRREAMGVATSAGAMSPAMTPAQTDLLVSLLTDPLFLGVAGGLVLVLAVVAAFAVRRLWRGLRRFAGNNHHLLTRARDELQTRTLPEGPARRAAELRRSLSDAVTETDRVVAATGHALVSATLAEQHHELGRLATSLDGHLLALQREPDTARVAAALPEAERWTDQLCDVAAEIREHVRASMTAGTDQDVRALGESTSDGAAALRAGIAFLQAQVRSRHDQ